MKLFLQITIRIKQVSKVICDKCDPAPLTHTWVLKRTHYTYVKKLLVSTTGGQVMFHEDFGFGSKYLREGYKLHPTVLCGMQLLIPTEIPASGAKVLIYAIPDFDDCLHDTIMFP